MRITETSKIQSFVTDYFAVSEEGQKGSDVWNIKGSVPIVIDKTNLTANIE